MGKAFKNEENHRKDWKIRKLRQKNRNKLEKERKYETNQKKCGFKNHVAIEISKVIKDEQEKIRGCNGSIDLPLDQLSNKF